MEKPWEGQRFLYCDVVKDRDKGTYNLWYSIYPEVNNPGLCYAVSEDGIHFERPELDWSNSMGQRPTICSLCQRALPMT